jgi:hypothetical protein
MFGSVFSQNPQAATYILWLLFCVVLVSSVALVGMNLSALADAEDAVVQLEAAQTTTVTAARKLVEQAAALATRTQALDARRLRLLQARRDAEDARDVMKLAEARDLIASINSELDAVRKTLETVRNK